MTMATKLLYLNVAVAALLPLLKVLGVVSWPWIWVLAPLWGGFVVWAGLLAGIIWALARMGY